MESARLPSERDYEVFYARFGGAYAASELIHADFCLLHALKDITVVDQVTRARYEEKLNHAESLTLGQLLNDLEETLPAPLVEAMRQVVDARNYLAHEFWRSRAILMLRSSRGVEELAAEATQYVQQFGRAREMLRVHADGVLGRLGISREGGGPESIDDLAAWLARSRDPVPRQVRVVRLWNVPYGGSWALVFETESDGLLQLCDVGLSRAPFEQVESTWLPVTEVNAYLPANVRSRPPSARPWEYQLDLKSRRMLWVGPGPPGSQFEWGLGRR